MLQDIRFALRVIRKRPLASVIVVLTLALGIAANAVFFSSFYGMVLRPLPFDEPERLVNLTESQPALGRKWSALSPANLEDWRKDSRVLAGAAAASRADFNLQTDDPESVSGSFVEAELFPLLGVDPAKGRHFLESEDVPGGPRVALISDDLWTRSFAGDPAIVGKTVRIDGEIHEIVGVMPEGFHFPNNGNLWVPFQLDPTTDRGKRHVSVIGRLADGVTMEQAQNALSAVAQRLAETYPETNRGWDAHVTDLRESWLPPITQLASAAQMVLVIGVLLIVCVNVTNIVLAQSTVRQQEMALRSAIGAGRSQLIRQALTESLILAAIAGVVGMLLGAWADTWMLGQVAIPIPYWLQFGMSPPVFAFVMALTLVTGVTIGLAPALRNAGTNLFEALKSGGRVEDLSRGRLRRALVVAEYAVALVILVAGLLMVKSFANLENADPGFDRNGLLTLRTSLKGSEWDDPGQRAAFFDEIQRRAAGLAGVESATVTSNLPISRNGYRSTTLEARGQVYENGEEPRGTLAALGVDYFETMKIPLATGRSFSAAEARDGASVAVVSQSLADLLWDGDAVGQEIRTGIADQQWLEVIGIAGNVEPGQMIAGLESSWEHQVYVPMGLQPQPVSALILRVADANADPTSLAAGMRSEIRRINAQVPVYDVLTMKEVMTQFYFAQHIWSKMFAAIALLALVIAAVGVYGVTAYSVSQRRREMGIRLALGAGPARLLSLVLRQGLLLAVAGIGLGLLGAIPLARMMEGLLHDMRALDLGVFLGVTGALLAVGLLASYLPGRRAANVNPLLALREE